MSVFLTDESQVLGNGARGTLVSWVQTTVGEGTNRPCRQSLHGVGVLLERGKKVGEGKGERRER